MVAYSVAPQSMLAPFGMLQLLLNLVFILLIISVSSLELLFDLGANSSEIGSL